MPCENLEEDSILKHMATFKLGIGKTYTLHKPDGDQVAFAFLGI